MERKIEHHKLVKSVKSKLVFGIFLFIGTRIIWINYFLEKQLVSIEILIGSVIVLVALDSLYLGKKWAQYFITLHATCSFIYLISSCFGNNIISNIIPTYFHALLLIAYFLIMMYLLFGEQYNLYSKLIQKGYSIKNNNELNAKNILSDIPKLKINNISFKVSSNYLDLVNNIFDYLLEGKVEPIEVRYNENKIEIEDLNSIYILDISNNENNLDEEFIAKLNQTIIDDFNFTKKLKLVYPESVLNEKTFFLGFIDQSEEDILIENGYCFIN